MKTYPSAGSAAEVQEFIADLREFLDDAEAAGSDMQRVAAVFDVHMRSTKAVASADLVVNVAKEGANVVIKNTDPNSTHSYTAQELIEHVNRKRQGRTLNSHDDKVLCWKEGLRDDPRMSWKHSKGQSHTWSGEAVKYMAGFEDASYDQIRAE